MGVLDDTTDMTDGTATVISKADTGAPMSGPNLVSAIAAQPDVERFGGSLPTTDPHIPGALWSNTGVTTTSAG